ncbi:MAG: LacI family DNA-binding transcriptional regulator [Kosmotogaceae bacterium]
MSKNKVTIARIAEDAGVSKMTVSRAINNPEKLKRSTLLRILNSMKKHGYKPRFIARVLAGSRSNTFGLIVKSNQDFVIPPFYGECVRGASEWFKSQNYRTVLFNMSDEQSRSLFLDYVNSGLIDGLILFEGSHDKSLLKTFKDNEVPVVLVGEDIGDENEFYSIFSDNYEGAKTAVDYLMRKGNKHIFHITGKGSKSSYSERLRAYNETLRNSGLKSTVIRTENSFQGGMKAIENILESGKKFDSLFCFSDLMAIGAIRILLEKGYKIPNDVRVIGYDSIKLSNYVYPSLTSISQNMKMMGELAAKTLFQIISGVEPSSKTLKVPTQLVIKESA